MKHKNQPTYIAQKYVFEHYVRHEIFGRLRPTISYSGGTPEEYIDRAYFVHSGSYRVKEHWNFASRKELLKAVQEAYPHKKYVSFYGSLEAALKADHKNQSFFVVRALGNLQDVEGFQLQRKKKTNPSSPRRRKHYHCDCWWCCKHSVEHTQHKLRKEEAKAELY